MMLELSIIAVFVVSFIAVRSYLPRVSAHHRLRLLFSARLTAALAFGLMAAQGHPTFWVFAVLFGIFAWRSKPTRPPVM